MSNVAARTRELSPEYKAAVKLGCLPEEQAKREQFGEQKGKRKAANDDNTDHQTGSVSAATTLVEMAQEMYEFGVSTTGETYAIPKTGPKLVALLRGSRTSLRGQLASKYFRDYRRAASQQALADSMLVIDGFAQEAKAEELHLRTASHNGELWLDIADLTGRAIRITAQGWSIEDHPPMLFKRTVLNGALPEPTRDGSLEYLWEILNVSKNDRPLVAAWLVACYFPDIPHCVLALFGEQGSGKTTAGKMIVSAIDPGPVPTRKPPRDSESWVTAASGSWVVGLDNLSDVSPWLSDSICRAVTGDGDVRRKLYTDGEHSVFAFRRCICLNGIDLGATRGDLSERMLPISLDRIPEDKRLAEDEIWPKWEQQNGKILGAILDLTTQVLKLLPSVELMSKPRMADFAKILWAVDRVLGTKGFDHYQRKLASLAADSLTGDAFTLMVSEMKLPFAGTSAGLLRQLTADKPPRGWPRDARRVTTLLKRAGPALVKSGWEVTNDSGHNESGVIQWTLIPPEIARNSSPSSLLPRENGAIDGETGITGDKYGTSQDDLIGNTHDGELTL